jgi:hypothetical protein
LTSEPTAKFQTLSFWFNVFIHEPKVEALGTCFRGDNRGFDTSISAVSRVHAGAEITGLGTASASLGGVDIHCGETARLNCQTDAIEETATATVAGGFSNFHVGNTYPDPEGGVYDTANQYVANLTVDIAASDPLVTVAPTVGADLMITVDAVAGKVQVKGAIDSWPWFEGYASADGGSPVALFQLEAPAGTDAITLLSPRNRPVDVEVVVVP